MDLSPYSAPTLAAARHYGVSPEHAFLLGDLAAGFAGLGAVWPPGHAHHLWALAKAQQEAGPAATLSLIIDLTALYRARRERAAPAA